jgi:hypothetical protein
MTNEEKQKQLNAVYKNTLDKIHGILCDNEEAYNFIVTYGEYTELVDDAVDEPKNIEVLEKLTNYASKVFSCNYWHKNGQQLFLVEQVIHLVYFNVVKWETAKEEWKRRDAKALSHCGYYMLFAVLLLETRNMNLVQELALDFMERNHLIHLQDNL